MRGGHLAGTWRGVERRLLLLATNVGSLAEHRTCRGVCEKSRIFRAHPSVRGRGPRISEPSLRPAMKNSTRQVGRADPKRGLFVCISPAADRADVAYPIGSKREMAAQSTRDRTEPLRSAGIKVRCCSFAFDTPRRSSGLPFISFVVTTQRGIRNQGDTSCPDWSPSVGLCRRE